MFLCFYPIIYWFSFSFLVLRHQFFKFFLSLRKRSGLLIRKYFVQGLGFRVFCFKKFLYLFLGRSHWYKMQIPASMFIFRRKGWLIFLGPKLSTTFDRFMAQLLKLRSFSRYKAKGFLGMSEWSLALRPRVLPQSQR